MQVEKLCNSCKHYFYYENGIDAGLAVDKEKYNLVEFHGFCPRCIDPHYVAGEGYKKETILKLFKRFMTSKGVNMSILPEDEVVNMMKHMEEMYKLYVSNGSYLTISIPPGYIFQGKNGQFEMGSVISREISPSIGSSPPHFSYSRNIRCVRCNRDAGYPKQTVLKFLTGLIQKRCIHCDKDHLEKRVFKTKPKGGSKIKPFSKTSMAKALNVSRNDYIRYNITERVPPLPNGTVVNGLEIIHSFWDDDPKSYQPKYRLLCNKCKNTFICIQKNVERIVHKCY